MEIKWLKFKDIHLKYMSKKGIVYSIRLISIKIVSIQ